MRFFDERTRARIIRNSVLSLDHFYEGTPCWDWIGSKLGNRPYGKFSYYIKSGRRKGRIATTGAHRISYMAFKGVGLKTRTVVRHMCNNSMCVNPAHFRRGTQTANNRDIVKSGRHGNATRKLIVPDIVIPYFDEDAHHELIFSIIDLQLTAPCSAQLQPAII